MSCLGSTRTTCSSTQSLASSALMTAISSNCTISDADYETSDEQFLSPKIVDNVDTKASPSSSNLRWTSSLLSSQSVSCLADTSDDFVTSSEIDKYAMSVKSDTCLNQQSKIISDFIDDMRLQQEQQQNGGEDSALSNKSSSTSVQTEFFPATNRSDSRYGSIIDINITDSPDAVEKEIVDELLGECINFNENLDKKIRLRLDEKAIRSTLSETTHKIIENLSQVTNDKLFSKEGCRYLNTSSSMTKTDHQRRSQGEQATTAAIRRLTSRRPFQRCRGVESLLQIDYELQPLNLMLSRLLAEFRAMDLKGKLGYVVVDSTATCLSDQNYTESNAIVMPEIKRTMMHQPNVTSFLTDVNSMQSHHRKEENTRTKYLYSLSHEYLSDNPAKGEEGTNYAQISRSCEDNCFISRDFFANGSSCCPKSAAKHPEYVNEPERNPQCHCETRCTADDHYGQKVISDEEEFGSGVIRLKEITTTN